MGRMATVNRTHAARAKTGTKKVASKQAGAKRTTSSLGRKDAPASKQAGAKPVLKASTKRTPSRPVRPAREEAERAVQVLLSFLGEDPTREGLVETPARVVRSFEEACRGYDEDPRSLLARTFSETNGYDEIILLTGIHFVSLCEHHMLPISGRAHIGYLPGKRVVGISKLARLVEIYAARLQVQEKMTSQIADALSTVLKPRGVGIVIEATHHCMSGRGVRKPGVVMTTSSMTGKFRSDPRTRAEFLALVGHSRSASGVRS